MKALADLRDQLCKYVKSTGVHLIAMHKGKQCIKSCVSMSDEFMQSSLAADVIAATSFLDSNASMSLRVKAVMQGVSQPKTCPVCGAQALVNSSSKMSIPLYSSTCCSKRCKMSYMSRCRKTTEQSRHNHSISMSKHKAHVASMRSKCIGAYLAGKFNCCSLDEVQAYCKSLIDGQIKNGALVREREWTDSLDMICSLMHHSKFIRELEHDVCLEDLSLAERVYCIAHGMHNQACCALCGGPVKFIDVKHGYAQTCARCAGERRRIAYGSIMFKDLLDAVDLSMYDIVDVQQKCHGDCMNSISVRCKRCGQVSKVIVHNMQYVYKIAKASTLCKSCQKYTSIDETELRQLVESIAGRENVISHDKSLIHPYELDIVVPKMKAAFEFNGSYWHDVNAVRKGYHLHKTMLCENAGYALMHIWEDEWHNDRERVSKMVEDLLLHRDQMFEIYAGDLADIDRSKICKLLVPSEIHIDAVLSPSVIRRGKYDVEDCGQLKLRDLA